MKMKLRGYVALRLMVVLISLPIVFCGQTKSDSLICNTKAEQMFFNETVFLKQKYKAENVMLLKSNTRLMEVINEKDGQLADKDKIIALNAQEREIWTQELGVLKSQLKAVKRQKTKLTIGGSAIIGLLLLSLGYSLTH